VPKTLEYIRIVLRKYFSVAAVVAASALTACGTSVAPAGSMSSAQQLPPAPALQGLAAVDRAGAISLGTLHSHASWMEPDASQGALLYVSDWKANKVDVYTYPGDALAGTLTNVEVPAGECVDAAGNVYVVEAAESGKILEFPHGGTSPIATLKAPSQFVPASCSIDPTSGDLAVADIEFATSKGAFRGDVLVYRHARGNPKRHTVINLEFYFFLAYDDAGNLFVDGSSGRPVQLAYAELPKGRDRMVPITLTGASIVYPGNVQWDGAHITIGDQDNAVIYQTEGSQIVGSTPLTGSSDVVGYFIDGGTVICSDAGNASVEFYNYPAGGSPTGELTGFREPFGAVVSP
jgi:hypothetical protein